MKQVATRQKGDTHVKAVLTDGEVEQLRALYEAGGWGYKRLAAKFEVSRESVRDIVKYRRR